MRLWQQRGLILININQDGSKRSKLFFIDITYSAPTSQKTLHYHHKNKQLNADEANNRYADSRDEIAVITKRNDVWNT
jgi:hypothetical protein